MADQKLIEVLERSSIAITTAQANQIAVVNALQSKEQEEMEARRWDEYLKLSDAIDKLRERDNKQLLFNFARHVKAIEKAIGISNDDSIVGDMLIIDSVAASDMLTPELAQPGSGSAASASTLTD